LVISHLRFFKWGKGNPPDQKKHPGGQQDWESTENLKLKEIKKRFDPVKWEKSNARKEANNGGRRIRVNRG